jgi:primary-amine oxidase
MPFCYDQVWCNLCGVQVNVEAMPRGADNPYGNGFKVVETELTTVHGAMRCWAPEKGRIWKIKNPSVINPITKAPVAFKLMATVCTCPYPLL